ncbi:MAG: M3 family oligoendopeptidase [Thaumarchaeota archaeon]|nr:M3 family oligoendopeptidase [Nitrososphaerota archaeon]
MQRLKLAPGRWDLTDALPEGEGPRLEKRLTDLRSKTSRFEAQRDRLKAFARGDVEGALRLYESIAGDVARITSQAYMKYTADTSDQRAKASMDRSEDVKAEIDNKILFFRLWWTGLGDSETSRLFPSNPDHRYFLGVWRNLRRFTLDEKVEQAVNLKNVTGFSGWTHHYDKIVSDFTFSFKVRGKAVRGPTGSPKVVVADVTRLFASPDPAAREAAYHALLSKYAANGEVLGEVYRTIARDWNNENVKMRGYASAIAPRNLENDVSDLAVETLLKVCRKNAGVFQEFFRLKAKMLGIGRMSRYHIYAPLMKKESKIGYAEAVEMVMDAFREFDPKVAKLALGVFEKGHVDAMPRVGKTNGAYCMSITPEVVPYLFLNFSGVTRDVYTIAHESGHAVHSQLSSSHSVLTFHPPLVLAETASVFGEMILFDKYMREEKDAELRRSVLLEKLSSMYATVGRQAYFVVFEKEAHPKVIEGATVSDLCALYSSVLKEQFGSAVSVPDEFKWEWTYIPHIYHTPFYCYAYAFGNLLSLALYDSYTKEGRSFVPRYLKLLSYGGSETPAKVLDEVGVDMSSEKFWQGGFDVVRRMTSELRKL